MPFLPPFRFPLPLAVLVLVMLQVLTMLVSTVTVTVHALDNGLARTPQMGWNSWNFFQCNLNESVVRATATRLVELGLADLGYQYVNLDDCWAKSRDADHRVVPDPDKFPSGMFALGDYIHSLGLKFGIYSDAGPETCASRPGSIKYEAIDAITYAAWGVDYLKYDNCFGKTDPRLRYPVMRDALNWTGRPILFSMCEWGLEDPATWAADVANSWRSTGDISANWKSMIGNADENNEWAAYAGPGHWNDPDMLEVGVGGGHLSYDEQVTHFSLWALMKAPLIIGADLSTISSEELAILANAEVIAIDQDPLGVQGRKYSMVTETGAEMWAGPLAANGSYAIVLVNRNESQLAVTADLTLLGWTAANPIALRDLWAHTDLGVFNGSYTRVLAPHASATLLATPVVGQDEKEKGGAVARAAGAVFEAM